MINDFEDFYKKDSKYGEKQNNLAESSDVKTTNNQATAHHIFDFKKYTKSENQKEFRERFVQSQAFIHFIEEFYHMDRGNIKQLDSMRFFKKQLSTIRKKSNNIKIMREMQDQKIEKFIHNYDTKQLVYGLKDCIT